jgi:hypothetical protein
VPDRTTKAFGTSSPAAVADAHHGGVGHSIVGEEHGLELGGRDLVALVLDHLLEPVDDVERAVGVDGD